MVFISSILALELKRSWNLKHKNSRLTSQTKLERPKTCTPKPSLVIKKKKKYSLIGWELYSRGRFRSSDLWVMGPARFRCATLLNSKTRQILYEVNHRNGQTRHLRMTSLIKLKYLVAQVDLYQRNSGTFLPSKIESNFKGMGNGSSSIFILSVREN